MVVDQFSQLTRSIADLKALAAEMWKEYSPPLDAVGTWTNLAAGGKQVYVMMQMAQVCPCTCISSSAQARFCCIMIGTDLPAAGLQMEPGINVETAVRKLLQHASSLSLVDRYLRVMEPGMCHPSHIAAAISAAAQQGSGAVASREHEDNWGAMPFTSRLLLVAGGQTGGGGLCHLTCGFQKWMQKHWCCY
jgi:hypothetical protein